MKQIIKIFNSKSLRCIIKNGLPYFNAQDTCLMLGLTNTSRAIFNLNKDDITTSNVIDSLGRNQEVYFISEQGLYDLIFKSKKQEAKEFQKWVTHEVLPSIRKTGQYSIPKELSKISTEKRNLLTSMWKEKGVEKGYHFANLTKEEYNQLFSDKTKKKSELTKKELLTLSVFESIEALRLFENDEVKGYYDCKKSLIEAGNIVKNIKDNKLKELESKQ